MALDETKETKVIRNRESTLLQQNEVNRNPKKE